MPKIIYVSCFNALPTGHGGNHRTYQILWELKQCFGDTQVHFFNSTPAFEFFQKYQFVNRMVDRIKENSDLLFKIMLASSRHSRIVNRLKNKLLDPKHHFGYIPPDNYDKLINEIGTPQICVVDHPSHALIIRSNLQRNIPVVICPHNIESFEIRSLNINNAWNQYTIANNLSKELQILSDCRDRLCISKVEAGMLGGLGIPSKYYAYYPVGVIRERLERIRERRAKELKEKGLFLLVGTAAHVTTKKAIEWFMNSAREKGLPPDVHVIVVGMGTEALKEEIGKVAGFEVAGWVEEEKLEELLVRATGVLAPQRTGFGALTRISEMACAGISLAVSRHASYAVDMPPGVRSVEDDWEAWWQAMEEMVCCVNQGTLDEYQNWYDHQQSVLPSTLSQFVQ